MGIYLIFVEQGFTREQVFMIANKEIQHNAHSLAEGNAKLTKMPFTYGLFPRRQSEDVQASLHHPSAPARVKYPAPLGRT